MRTNSHGKLITIPIFILIVITMFTYFPVIYKYLPFLGEIRIVLLAGIGLAISFILSSADYTNKKIYRNPVLFAWLGFFVVMVMTLIVSYDRGLTLNKIEANLKYFIVFLVMIKIIDSDKRLDLFMGVFGFCGAGMALITNLNYLVLGETFRRSDRAMALRRGIFGDPNDLALLFIITLPILLYYLLTRRKKLFPIFGIIATIAAILFTYSRGGFIGLCVTGLGFILLVGKKKKPYVFLALIIGILYWTLAPEEYKERISTIKEEAQIDEETGKYPGRLEAWRIAIREGMDRPILGAGAGCSYYIAGQSSGDWHVIHNSFIQVFVEMGLFGLLFFIPLFILPFRQYRKYAKHKAGEFEIPLQRFRFILLCLASFASTALFLPQAYSPILYTLSGISLIQSELISKSTVALEIEESNVIVNPSSDFKT